MGQRSIVVLVLGLAILSSGVFVFTNVAGAEQQREAIENATTVEAEIVHSSVRVDEAIGEDRTDTYYANVEFVYEFRDERYRSDHTYPGSVAYSSEDETEVRELVREYPEGTNVTAYVDPVHPGEAFLLEETTGTSLLMTRLLSGVMGVLGAGLVVAGLGVGGDAFKIEST